MVSRLIALLLSIYHRLLRIYPREFYVEFGEEMTEIFGERLAEVADKGVWAVLILGLREWGQMPLAVGRLYIYQGQKKWQWVRQLRAQLLDQILFGVPPVANDGRFSRRQLIQEMTPFLLTAGLILLLTYSPPLGLPARWRDPLELAFLWAGVLSLPALLYGLWRGMPRWSFPYAGLVCGYTLWAAAGQRLLWFWGSLLVNAIILVIMAALVNRADQPLAPFWKRVGASVALDWTRVSFGVFGAAPIFILVAFDNAFINQRTPYLALAMLLMVATASFYGRCRRQDRQIGILLVGATLMIMPAYLDHVFWPGGGGDTGWLLNLWVAMVSFLLLPLLVLPVQWMTRTPSGRGEL